MINLRFAAVLLMACLGCANQDADSPVDDLSDVQAAGDDLSDVEGGIVIDDVSIGFGKTVELSGICLKNDSFSADFGAATIRALRIGGKPNQEEIVFHLQPNSGKRPPNYDKLQNLIPGRHYLVRGKLLNARINGVNNACSLRAERVEEIAASRLRIADFIHRKAAFDGVAGPNGAFKCGDETATLDSIDAWPKEIVDKPVSVSGIVRKDDRGLRFEQPSWKLYRLEDMVNQTVVLDGTIASLNGECWFNYRRAKLFLTSATGPVLRFALSDQNRPVRVTGSLVLQDRPSLNQIAVRSDRDLAPSYVIRHASVEFTGPELSWEEKYGPFYPSHHRSKNGVLELLPEPGFCRNLFGVETQAMLFFERNSQVIQRILHELSAEHRDELARRLADEKSDQVLRLLYAAMLANVNDARGRTYLLKAVEIRRQEIDANALYCLGVFPYLAAGDGSHEVELAWAEKPLVELMRDQNKVAVRGAALGELNGNEKSSVARAAAIYSAIPSVMRQIGSDNCRRSLLDFVSASDAGSNQVAQELCRWKPPLAPDELVQLDKLVDDHSVHRMILQLLLQQKAAGVVDRYQNDLEDSFVYMDFRDLLSPGIVDQLQARVDQFGGKAKVHAQMLIALGRADPVAELLKLLSNPAWTDKNIVFFELARLGDPRAVAPIARFLRKAPKAAVKDDKTLSATNTVSYALEAIAHAGTSEAIHELIELLPVDLGRFGGYIKRDGWQRVVAGHLIELTGESFGADVGKWRAWQLAHPEHSVPRELANPGGYFRSGPGANIDFGQ